MRGQRKPFKIMIYEMAHQTDVYIRGKKGRLTIRCLNKEDADHFLLLSISGNAKLVSDQIEIEEKE